MIPGVNIINGKGSVSRVNEASWEAEGTLNPSAGVLGSGAPLKQNIRLSRAGESRREYCWGYVFIYENTPKKLPNLPPKSCCNFMQLYSSYLEVRHSFASFFATFTETHCEMSGVGGCGGGWRGGGFSSPAQSSSFLICVSNSASVGYRPHLMPGSATTIFCSA